jgi:hypothetical protein
MLRSGPSSYQRKFSQGANFVPYFLFNVKTREIEPLNWGWGDNQVEVSSRRSPNEKLPWKKCRSLTDAVEQDVIYPLYTGETILPFRCLSPTARVVIPWDGEQLLDGPQQVGRYPGLARWWEKAELVWNEHRKDMEMSLLDQVDYRGKLTKQLSASGPRIVYGGSGMYMAAAIVAEEVAVVEHQLYWGLTASLDEARYLVAILNSTVVTLTVRLMQRRGEQNPRHVGKKVFLLPIPPFDACDASHAQLVDLEMRAEQVAQATRLPKTRFELQRKRLRQALVEDGVMGDIDQIVEHLIKSTQ